MQLVAYGAQVWRRAGISGDVQEGAGDRRKQIQSADS